MTEIERKALALVNEVLEEWEVSRATEDDMDGSACFVALCRAIERHEAFRQEVSDAVEDYCGYVPPDSPSHPITRFILPKPVDPLVEAMQEACGAQGLATKHTPNEADADNLRQALAARGLKITNI